MINTCLLEMLSSGLHYNIGHFNPPFMDWENNTHTATLHVDPIYNDLTPNAQLLGASGFAPSGNIRYEIYFNTRLYQLFNTLPTTYVNATGDLNYRVDMPSPIIRPNSLRTTAPGIQCTSSRCHKRSAPSAVCHHWTP